ncbi:unnamed protein product [Ilex paraguariensis]|uniref:Cyclin N-terminal domain-containing protein n=1 Tax=Ilex paraguariensis TaxID=185542 RepID=A0ABC8SLR4_9AQUA
MKLKVQSVPLSMKKLRSKLPRRKRPQISPVLLLTATGEVSGDSRRVSVKKIGFDAFSAGEEFRRVTRSYYKQKQSEKRNFGDREVELSETSCVESCSGAFFEVSGERNSKTKSRIGKGIENVKEIERIEEISSVEQFSGEMFKSGAEKVKRTEYSLDINQNEVSSVVSQLNSYSPSQPKFGNVRENRVSGDVVVSEISRNCAESNLKILNSESSVKQIPKLIAVDFDLACSEQISYSYDDVSCYPSAFTELQSDIFHDSSFDFSDDYSSSIWCDSGSQFSERSIDDSSPSPTFQLFLQFRQQFCRSTCPVTASKFSSHHEEDNCDQNFVVISFHSIHFLSRFEEEEHEESYKMMRERERREVYLHDYAEEYCSSTDRGELVIQQRLQMVHWIVEECPTGTALSFMYFPRKSDESKFDKSLHLGDGEWFAESGEYVPVSRESKINLAWWPTIIGYSINVVALVLLIDLSLLLFKSIKQQSTNKELQRETMFLGVCLLDRFLSKGYFKTKRNLQIAGIACLTLATRIEENQPFNSVRQKSFYSGSNVYSRCEVVAMEWLVQEVLNFQCFLPTMYNFLWFYLEAAKANQEVEKTSKYLAVLALLGHEQLCYWPSSVAAGLVILASLAANQDASCQLVTKIHARTKDDDLPQCIKVCNNTMPKNSLIPIFSHYKIPSKFRGGNKSIMVTASAPAITYASKEGP